MRARHESLISFSAPRRLALASALVCGLLCLAGHAGAESPPAAVEASLEADEEADARARLEATFDRLDEQIRDEASGDHGGAALERSMSKLMYGIDARLVRQAAQQIAAHAVVRPHLSLQSLAAAGHEIALRRVGLRPGSTALLE